jgi:hypothetical protein
LGSRRRILRTLSVLSIPRLRPWYGSTISLKLCFVVQYDGLCFSLFFLLRCV